MGIFHGPTQTTNTQQNTAQQSTSLNQGSTQGLNTVQSSNTTTPNLPAWYSTFLSSLPGQYQSLQQTLTQNSQKPLYGAPQQAAFQDNLNHQTGQLSQQLLSQLAAHGRLNSASGDQAQTQLALGSQKQLNDYLQAVPQLNAQNQLATTSQLNQLLGNQSGFTSPISAFGTTSTGNQTSLSDLITQALSQASGTSNSTGSTSSTTTPNILGGLLGGAINGGLGLLAK